MPCDHKFRDHLELEKIDFTPVTLVVGTFSPAWPETNTAEWFYGRTEENCFWDVLPRLYGEPSLIDAGPVAWQAFCRRHGVALTDLIACVEDADEDNKNHGKILGGFSDKAIVYNFDDLVFTNVVALLRRHPSIKNVYITRGVTEAFWKHLWHPVTHYCSVNGLHERKLLTPTDESAYHHEAHNQEAPQAAIARFADYVLLRWGQEWHQ